MDYETVIGLEVHLQLDTKSKAFCGCSTDFGNRPNTQACPVCLGLPGSLPVLNKQALFYAAKVALALNCQIANFIKFDRKNYFYPDLPKNFQISQYDKPLSQHGQLQISLPEGKKTIGIRRVHLEEDTGKLLHQEDASLIDYNRSGIPLLEIVSEPDINSPEEAYAYLTALKGLLEYLDVSDCDMEKGSLRCDANISLRPEGTKDLGTKTEIKNMNSFKAVRQALAYEARRQAGLLSHGERIVQETRLWDSEKLFTASMRSKEEAHDYRYFPEPDLAPFIFDQKEIEMVRASLPELPQQRKERFIKEYGIPEYDAGVLTQDRTLADFFQGCAKIYPKPKVVANWLMGDILARLNQDNLALSQTRLTPTMLVEMLELLDSGAIGGKVAKEILPQLIEAGVSAKELISEKGLGQISDSGAIEAAVDRVIQDNPKPVGDYKNGKKTTITFLIGAVMKQTRGRANPVVVRETLEKKLGK